MLCPNCGQETEQGKFCTSCGAQLANEEIAAAADPTINTAKFTEQPIQEQATIKEEPNESVEKVKEAGANFGHFFMNLMKKPSAAKKANSNDLISGIITIVLFSLFISLSAFITIKAFSGPFGPSFVDGFLLPFIQFIILFGIVAAITYGGAKLTAQNLSITTVIAKYAAYLVPFMLLFAVGIVLSLIKLPALPGVVLSVSMLGPIFVVPTMILLEKEAKGIDRTFVLIGVYTVSLLAFWLLVQSVASAILGGILGSFMGGFGW